MSDKPTNLPADPVEAPLTDHEYDGIKEYDNPIPAWWSWLFWLSIVFSIVYFVFFHMGQQGWTITDRYSAAVAANAQHRRALLGDLTPNEATLKSLFGQSDMLALGREIFKGNCTSCHGGDGAGLVGPNLTDHHYKNVKTLQDVIRVVSEGAANGAMPPWKTRLESNDLILVSAYVASLRGAGLTSNRGTEGEIIPAW